MTDQYGPTPTSQGIRGYRELPGDQVSAINQIKDAQWEFADLWKSVRDRDGVDMRWVAIARTHFEEGFSALVRAIARPQDPFADQKEGN